MDVGDLFGRFYSESLCLGIGTNYNAGCVRPRREVTPSWGEFRKELYVRKEQRYSFTDFLCHIWLERGLPSKAKASRVHLICASWKMSMNE